jgi:hypothetical protein
MQREQPAVSFEFDACRFDVRGVEIGGDEQAIRADALQEFEGVPCESERAIDERLAGLGLQRSENFSEQHGLVFASRGGTPNAFPPKRPSLLFLGFFVRHANIVRLNPAAADRSRESTAARRRFNATDAR